MENVRLLASDVLVGGVVTKDSDDEVVSVFHDAEHNEITIITSDLPTTTSPSEPNCVYLTWKQAQFVAKMLTKTLKK